MGYLLAQQLIAQGEEVLDVPATLASRIRVLATGRSNKNDPNDAHSIAIAALRAPALRSVEPADHGEVLRLLSKRNRRSEPGTGQPRRSRPFANAGVHRRSRARLRGFIPTMSRQRKDLSESMADSVGRRLLSLSLPGCRR
jgi:hypothetical protein